jgi:hypothetical protein
MYFISYSSKDEEIVLKYIKKLKARVGKENVWFAPEKISGSKFYAKEIVKAIEKSKAILLFLSKNSLTSPHVLRELNLAVSKGKKIYPLRIEDVFPNDEFGYFLNTIQWIDIFKEEDFDNFLDEIFRVDIKIEESEFKDFVILHFEEMGYKVKKEGEFLEVKKDGEKRKIEYKILPIYQEFMNVGQFKVIEAESLWKYKNKIFKQNDLNEFFKEYKFKDNPTFKQKMLFAQKMKDKVKKENIVFYLYVKNPPIFHKQKFQIGLIDENKYKKDEIMPQIYINSVYKPGWWAVGRDNLEIVKDERYKNITIAVIEAYKKLKYNLNKQRESYNGRLAESLCEVFFRNNGYLVQKFGIENVLGNTLKLVNMYNDKLENKEDLFKYMTLPDYLVMKVDKNNQLQENFLLDVKFRHYYSKDDFYKDLKEGDIKKQAQKYSNFWGNIYLFIIVDFGDEGEVFFDKVENIKNGKIKTLDESSFKDEEIKKLKNYMKAIWGK